MNLLNEEVVDISTASMATIIGGGQPPVVAPQPPAPSGPSVSPPNSSNSSDTLLDKVIAQAQAQLLFEQMLQSPPILY